MTAISSNIQPANRNRASVGILSIKGNKGSATPEASLELKYSRTFEKNTDFAKNREVIYKWVGNHFRVVSEEEFEKSALDWLIAHYPDQVNPGKITSCANIARRSLRSLPNCHAEDAEIVIPLKNAYLVIDGQGNITRKQPDMAYGMTYVINVELPAGGSNYAPSPIPSESLLAKYFGSSIPDLEARNFLQELAGDSLSPVISTHKAALLKGGGKNGKSIFIRLLQALHGSYAAMSLDRLKGFNLAPLIGASLAIADEVPRIGLDTESFKKLTSGDPVSIDQKYEKVVSYQPHAKWFICTNHDQQVSDNSNGFWRRMLIIPFNQTISDEDTIPNLDQKIINHELIHFLDWCLLGLQRFISRGSKLTREPASVIASKKSAQLASDTVFGWIDENEVEVSATSVMIKDHVYANYDQWCGRNGLKKLSSPAFWKLVQQHLGVIEAGQASRQQGRKRLVSLSYGSEVDDSHPF